MSSWLDAGPLSAIPVRGARVLETPHGPIALFRTSDVRVFALRDRCPHRGGPLSQGIVHGLRVTCPLHSLLVDLRDGRAVAPDEGCVASHPVRIENGQVVLAIGSDRAELGAA